MGPVLGVPTPTSIKVGYSSKLLVLDVSELKVSEVRCVVGRNFRKTEIKGEKKKIWMVKY